MSKPFDVSLMTSEELQFLTKPIATYNNTLIDQNELKRQLKFSHPRTWTGPKTQDGGNYIGNFVKLPLEAVINIFKFTDIQSLMHLRATNSGLKFIVESWRPFRTAMTDAQPAIMALVATAASSLWTFMDLKPIIYSTQCHICDEHGEILHLLKLKRACFRCVTSDRKLLAVTDTYAIHQMGLTESDLSKIPSLYTVAQRGFWGLQNTSGIAVDYSAAVELAMTKQNPSQNTSLIHDVRSLVPVSYATNGDQLIPSPARRTPVDANMVYKPLQMRRAAKHNDRINLRDLPSFLLNPPETSYIQHACCVHLPALKKPVGILPARPVRALLCAGCSFYFNHHSALPHQAHTLYPCDSTSSNIPDVSHKQPVLQTPLLQHIQDCIFANLYFNNYLYPAHLSPTPNNPNLTANGGRYTSQQLVDDYHNHRIALLAPRSAQYQHFQKHTIDSDGRTRVSMAKNNQSFEMMPLNFLELGFQKRKLPKRTGLDMELNNKLTNGDQAIVTLFNQSQNEKLLDPWTIEKISELRKEREKTKEEEGDQDIEIDRYGDVLLGNTNTVSQASWATARPSSSNCLFRGWTSLLIERKRKHEVAEAREQGSKKPRMAEMGGNGWGMDRFGCVSDLG